MLPLAILRMPAMMSKRIVPLAKRVCWITSSSPGFAGLRNLTELISQLSSVMPVAAAIAFSAVSSSTTPGRMGVPGKCPAKAG